MNSTSNGTHQPVAVTDSNWRLKNTSHPAAVEAQAVGFKRVFRSIVIVSFDDQLGRHQMAIPSHI